MHEKLEKFWLSLQWTTIQPGVASAQHFQCDGLDQDRTSMISVNTFVSFIPENVLPWFKKSIIFVTDGTKLVKINNSQ